MIKMANISQLEYIAHYAYSLNSIPKHKCKAFPTDYDNVIKQFKKIINHPNDELLISVEDNNILGVLALLVEPEDMYIEFIGGIFAKENYQIVANEFFNYIKNKYKGFYLHAAYPEENMQARRFMESIGAELQSFDYEYRLNRNDYKNIPDIDNIIRLNSKHYRDFINFHDKFNSDAYWTGQRLINSIDKFNIFVAIEKGKIKGSVVTSNFKNDNKTEEIYFLNVIEDKQDLSLKGNLLNKAVKNAFDNDTDQLMIMIDKNDMDFDIYENLGFKKVDTCLTYSLKIN